MLLAVHILSYGMHLGSLESTQEARVALSYCLEQFLRFFRNKRMEKGHSTGYQFLKSPQISHSYVL